MYDKIYCRTQKSFSFLVYFAAVSASFPGLNVVKKTSDCNVDDIFRNAPSNFRMNTYPCVHPTAMVKPFLSFIDFSLRNVAHIHSQSFVSSKR